MPRRMWKLGRIERLITGTDGNICTADIYLPGNRHMQRSIAHWNYNLYDEQADKSSLHLKMQGILRTDL